MGAQSPAVLHLVSPPSVTSLPHAGKEMLEQTVMGVLSSVLDVHDKSYPRAKLVEFRPWKMYL